MVLLCKGNVFKKMKAQAQPLCSWLVTVLGSLVIIPYCTMASLQIYGICLPGMNSAVLRWWQRWTASKPPSGAYSGKQYTTMYGSTVVDTKLPRSLQK